MTRTLKYIENEDKSYDINYEYETLDYEYSDGMFPVLANYSKQNISKKELDEYIKEVLEHY